MHSKKFASIGSLAIALSFSLHPLSMTGLSAAPQEKEAKSAENRKGDAKAGEKKEAKYQFLRILKAEDGTPTALQTGITRYTIEEGEYKGVQIDLVGAVHVGHRAYYQALNERFKKYDQVLYELVADREVNIPQPNRGSGGNPLGMVQHGMKDALGLEFQLDEVNYKAKNFVHADMSPSEFAEDMKKRGDGFVSMFSRMLGASIAAQSGQAAKGSDVKMLSAMLTKDRYQMRQAMAEQFENMEVQMTGFADASGRSTIVTERNAKVMEVLAGQLKENLKTYAIFYGAAHLQDMDERLIKDFHAKRGDTEWLTAWELSETK